MDKIQSQKIIMKNIKFNIMHYSKNAIVLICLLINFSVTSVAATVIGVITAGGSEAPGVYSIVIDVHIVNTTETPLHVPTKGFKYYSDIKLESGTTKVFALLKEERSITGFNMPFSKDDLRIVKLLKNEAAVVRFELEIRGDRLTSVYDATIELDEVLAKRYNFSPGLYQCSVTLPGETPPRSQGVKGNTLKPTKDQSERGPKGEGQSSQVPYSKVTAEHTEQ